MTLDTLVRTLTQAQAALELLEQFRMRTRLTYATHNTPVRLEQVPLPNDDSEALARLFYALHGNQQ